jgi:ferredoxin
LTIAVKFLPSSLEAEVLPGTTLLEAARVAGQPLGRACHGEAVCGRCRLRIVEGGEAIARREAGESRVLTRVGARADERLGCCARVVGLARARVTVALP